MAGFFVPAHVYIMVLYSLYTPFITCSTQQGTACKHEHIFKTFAHFGNAARLLRKKTKHNLYPQKSLANSSLGTSSTTTAVWVYMIFKLKLTFKRSAPYFSAGCLRNRKCHCSSGTFSSLPALLPLLPPLPPPHLPLHLKRANWWEKMSKHSLK